MDKQTRFQEPTKVTVPFQLPANLLLVGETSSGKSCWIEKLLEHKDAMFSPPPSKILLLYRKMQPLYEQWETKFPFLEMAEGINQEIIESQKDERGNGTLLILDDLMAESVTDQHMQMIYTAGRHYSIMGTLTVWHNVFPKGKNSRLIGLNCTGYVLMRSPRISSQIPTLGSQLGIRKQMVAAYQLATEQKPYSYLVVDFTNRSNPKAWRYALRSNVFPSDKGMTEVYGTPTGHREEL